MQQFWELKNIITCHLKLLEGEHSSRKKNDSQNVVHKDAVNLQTGLFEANLKN